VKNTNWIVGNCNKPPKWVPSCFYQFHKIILGIYKFFKGIIF